MQYTHIIRARDRSGKSHFVKATKARCVRENLILPWMIVGFFGFVVLTALGVV